MRISTGLALAIAAITAAVFTTPWQQGRQFSQKLDSPAVFQTVKGAAIKGTVFQIEDEQGRSQQVKISDVERDPTDPDQDIYLYTVLVQTPGTSQWQNLCQPDREGIAKAIPLAGQWDETGKHVNNDQLTFACTNGVLAKCVRWGYKPWKTIAGQSLQDYHQACTRMARADYCGDGTGHTREGTPIDVYDRLNIQTHAAVEGMTFEAAWNPEGAVFIQRPRYSETLAYLQSECPEKLHPAFNQVAPSTPVDHQQSHPTALIFNHSVAR